MAARPCAIASVLERSAILQNGGLGVEATLPLSDEIEAIARTANALRRR